MARKVLYFTSNTGAGPFYSGAFSTAGDSEIEAINFASPVTDIDVSHCINLTAAYFLSNLSSGGTITSFVAVNCPAIKMLDIEANDEGAPNPITDIDLSGAPNIEQLYLYGNSFADLSIAALSLLVEFDVSGNATLSAITLPATAAFLNSFSATNCALSSSAVDDILVLLAGNAIDNGGCDLSGGANGVPSATGLIAKATLEGRGWSVTVNE
jgi:hypothetical protein